LRGGFLGQVETTTFDTTSSVLPVKIINNGARTGGLYGVYLQDEWRIFPALTLNSGLRFDGVNEFTNETQLSPRVNLVMKATDSTRVHAGYSRYFVPPPFELVTPTAISLFNNTTNAPAVQQGDTTKVERSHYFDVGVTRSSFLA
jgi:outer membrane receptor for ferrienterochelin and colicin